MNGSALVAALVAVATLIAPSASAAPVPADIPADVDTGDTFESCAAIVTESDDVYVFDCDEYRR